MDRINFLLLIDILYIKSARCQDIIRALIYTRLLFTCALGQAHTGHKEVSGATEVPVTSSLPSAFFSHLFCIPLALLAR